MSAVVATVLHDLEGVNVVELSESLTLDGLLAVLEGFNHLIVDRLQPLLQGRIGLEASLEHVSAGKVVQTTEYALLQENGLVW